MLLACMTAGVNQPLPRIRILVSRFLQRFGFRDDSFVLILAVIVGVVTAIAAVGFHELINLVRNQLYLRIGEQILYGKGLALLILLPAAGGLAVGIISRFIFRTREGHGVVDVIESVIRSSGFEKPVVALEKILTSAVTIGSGGSAGAEGPIVQIGAAIASGVGRVFHLARGHMPTLVACGAAAGISAIFNAPFGGVLFTLEVILLEFSVRSLAPIVVASVIAQVSTLGLMQGIYHLRHEQYQHQAIFAMPAWEITQHSILNWGQVGNFVILGLLCGLVGLCLIRSMYATEKYFAKNSLPEFVRPALGGALLGLLGVAYVLLFGRLMLHQAKPIPYDIYPMPAFFGDGYGAIQLLLSPKWVMYDHFSYRMLALLLFLLAAKVVGTCLTLGSGGSGGIIAPSVFLGAVTGAIVGALLQRTGWFPTLSPEVYALVGMGAVLAAVVHAPLASILIVFELTQDYKVMLPAMLACVVAVGVARLLYRDSIYTLSLRLRGIRPGAAGDLSRLRRLNIEQVGLEPAFTVRDTDPFQKVVDLLQSNPSSTFVVIDAGGAYCGIVADADLRSALLDQAAIPLLLVRDVMRTGVQPIQASDDLAMALEAFSRQDVNYLPVAVDPRSQNIVGLVSRGALLRLYSRDLSETT